MVEPSFGISIPALVVVVGAGGSLVASVVGVSEIMGESSDRQYRSNPKTSRNVVGCGAEVDVENNGTVPRS